LWSLLSEGKGKFAFTLILAQDGARFLHLPVPPQRMLARFSPS